VFLQFRHIRDSECQTTGCTSCKDTEPSLYFVKIGDRESMYAAVAVR
jgi:hypothetical protein